MINGTFLVLIRQDLLKYAEKASFKGRKGNILMLLRANLANFWWNRPLKGSKIVNIGPKR